jgi:class 3 adenylate cyclase
MRRSPEGMTRDRESRIYEYLGLHSLRAKFLLLIMPLLVLSTAVVFGISEYAERSDAADDLQDKLNKLVEIQSAVLSEPLWNIANQQIELILAAISIDPDVQGARVFDETGEIVAVVGTLEGSDFIAARNISYASGRAPQVIGRLEVALTDARLRFETGARLLVLAGLAGLLLVSVIIIVLIGNRRTIGIPMHLLLDAINRSRDSGERIAVDWRSKDEIGEVVAAFNEMQIRQQVYEGQLERAHNELEARVQERTSELREKSNALSQLSAQLAKYLPPQVYDSIFKGEQEVKVASSRKKLTVFFSDIAGFTETADRLESEELTGLVNHYLTEMSNIAMAHGGTIDKYMGDGIMIFFGDPETKGTKQDALSCVKMAIEMRERMRFLADTWRGFGIERPLKVRMGIHTGFCTVGNIGSESRMDYTIIGSGANTASRLESAATPGEILISYETFAQVKTEVLCEEHGMIEVKGLAYPVTTYVVTDTYESLGRQHQKFKEIHPNFTLDLDLDAMTPDEKKDASDMLRRGMSLLAEKGEPPLTRRPSQKGSKGR